MTRRVSAYTRPHATRDQVWDEFAKAWDETMPAGIDKELLVGRARIERATNWLKASCSTD
jgi:hypothetical protein